MVGARLIKWLRECYREDHTRAGVRNFFSASIENRLIVRSDDRLACGLINEDVLLPSYAEKLQANLALNLREKEFLYGCLFLTGEIGQKKYRAPLILYPATLTTINNAATVTIDHSLYRINYSLLDVLDNKEQIEEGIIKTLKISNGELSITAVSDIAKIIQSAMPEINTTNMIEWPHLVPVTNSQTREGLHILPAAGWCVVKRSSGSSGVIDELDKLSALQLTEWSSALKTVMGSDVEKNLTPASKLFKNAYITPARLSENQAHLLKSARSNNLTVCHGPPGTGKSFTIANMAIDHILRGESVLIVSKKDHAVDVIYDIITNLLGSGESMVRAGRKQYLRDLKNYLAKVLSTRSEEEVESDEYLTSTFKKLLDDIDRIERKLNEAINDSLNRSSIVATPVLKWYQKLLK